MTSNIMLSGATLSGVRTKAEGKHGMSSVERKKLPGTMSSLHGTDIFTTYAFAALSETITPKFQGSKIRFMEFELPSISQSSRCGILSRANLGSVFISSRSTDFIARHGYLWVK